MNSVKKRRRAVVDPSACVACGCCVKVCPLQAIEIVRGVMAQVRQDKCVGCGKCAKVCQMDVDVTRTPDHAECIRCGKCVGACPVDAISFRYGLGVTGDKPAQSTQACENK